MLEVLVICNITQTCFRAKAYNTYTAAPHTATAAALLCRIILSIEEYPSNSIAAKLFVCISLCFDSSLCQKSRYDRFNWQNQK